jgi:integrase
MQALPDYIASMMLFGVNTGARRGEILELRWSWVVQNHSAFLIPPQFHKTGESIGSRLLVCNSVAWAVVQEARGRNAEFVFTFRGKPVKTFYGRAWKKARKTVGLDRVRVHDLRHTFATRLEAAGVPRSDVAELLGHAASGVTRRYIAPDITRLLQEAEKVVAMKHEPVLRIVG